MTTVPEESAPESPVENEEETPQDEPSPREGAPMLGAQTASLRDYDPEAPLFVPVTNVNYIPDEALPREAPKPGVPITTNLEGFVPDHPGNDPTLVRIKQSLEAQGLPSGDSDNGPGNGPKDEVVVDNELPQEETEPADPPVEPVTAPKDDIPSF